MKKAKDIVIALITLAYVIVIGDMILNNERYIFKETWLLLLVIILLGIGLYCFLKYNSDK